MPLRSAQASLERHFMDAEVLGAQVTGAFPEDAGKILAQQIVQFMRDLDVPNGL